MRSQMVAPDLDAPWVITPAALPASAASSEALARVARTEPARLYGDQAFGDAARAFERFAGTPRPTTLTRRQGPFVVPPRAEWLVHASRPATERAHRLRAAAA